MKSIQIGSDAVAPVSRLPTAWLSLKPSQTVATNDCV